MTFTILIVEKFGSIKESSLKTYNESELYKKAGFKIQDDFKCRAQWNIDSLNNKSYYISVFGKITGRANQENKYEFPPPIDNILMFGNCIIVNKDKNNNISSLSEEDWESVYEYLFGGFDDIDEKDSDDEDYEDDDDIPKTKNGYLKDGFVVEDDEEEDEEDDEEEEEEEEEENIKSKLKKLKIISKEKSKNKKKELETIFTTITEVQENYLDCTSELSEEEYMK
jgi:hypothetical protein